MRIIQSNERFPHGSKFKGKPKWIVIHYTGVACASASNVCKSLTEERQKNRECKSSTHFVVDDKEIISCVPENIVAWHVGDGKCAQPDKKNPKTLRELAGIYASNWRYDLAAKNHMRWIEAGEDFKGNREAIGVDLCVNKTSTKTRSAVDCDWCFDDKTTENAINLVAYLCTKYDIPLDRVIRHADATGKPCPRPFVSLPNDNIRFADGLWEWFKRRVKGIMDGGVDAVIEQ